jgi:hypothetical protein
MEYQVVTTMEANGSAGLTKKVTALIEEGWRPLGPAQMCPFFDSYHKKGSIKYLQAMVRGDQWTLEMD